MKGAEETPGRVTESSRGSASVWIKGLQGFSLTFDHACRFSEEAVQGHHSHLPLRLVIGLNHNSQVNTKDKLAFDYDCGQVTSTQQH